MSGNEDTMHHHDHDPTNSIDSTNNNNNTNINNNGDGDNGDNPNDDNVSHNGGMMPHSSDKVVVVEVEVEMVIIGMVGRLIRMEWIWSIPIIM